MLVFLTAAYEIQPHMIGPDGAPIYGVVGRLARSSLMTVGFFLGTFLVILATMLYSLGWPSVLAQLGAGQKGDNKAPYAVVGQDLEMAAKSAKQ